MDNFNENRQTVKKPQNIILKITLSTNLSNLSEWASMTYWTRRSYLLSSIIWKKEFKNHFFEITKIERNDGTLFSLLK